METISSDFEKVKAELELVRRLLAENCGKRRENLETNEFFNYEDERNEESSEIANGTESVPLAHPKKVFYIFWPIKYSLQINNYFTLANNRKLPKPTVKPEKKVENPKTPEITTVPRAEYFQTKSAPRPRKDHSPSIKLKLRQRSTPKPRYQNLDGEHGYLCLSPKVWM